MKSFIFFIMTWQESASESRFPTSPPLYCDHDRDNPPLNWSRRQWEVFPYHRISILSEKLTEVRHWLWESRERSPSSGPGNDTCWTSVNTQTLTTHQRRSHRSQGERGDNQEINSDTDREEYFANKIIVDKKKLVPFWAANRLNIFKIFKWWHIN